MQVSIETTSGLERRLTVGVPAARVDSEVDERLKKAAKNVKMPGFRPGKVPMKVMRQRFGAGVRQEVLGEVMSQSFQEAVVQENLRPAGQPSIEPKSLDAGKDLEYIATFEVFPEVEVADMEGFAVEKPVAEVTDEDVDNIIEVFRKQQGEWQAVERAAVEGDRVNISYVGTKDGEAFEGGSAEDSELELGSGRMIPGFEDGIVGMQAGDEKTLELTFPDEYHNEDLKGAAVEFKVTVNTVEEMVPAALNEELFEKYGVEEGGEEQFRKEVAENMARELKNAVDAKVKQQVMDAVIAAHENVDIPRALIAQEVDALRNQMFQQFGGAAGQDLDLKSLLPDDMFTENAEKRVKLGLVLSELIKKLELKAEAERVRATIEEMASTYQEPEEVINWYYSNQEQLASVESKVLEDQVVEKLLEGAKIAEKACSYQEAIAPAEQEDA
ncbi:trigger factor [Pseudohalioglobus sediminis]|uniref:Trigger factor n=1 Tax=Pseudohalioglobus sediminis TaxID=2606449 RepID=A0A5B0X1J5_9GAMM|nr:trigger factor [Pseudohalioglobus sediminis]KAA1193143.1 trigger factor [Pseudohalioglobus sediminis]